MTALDHVSSPLVLIPAYGRRYDSAAPALVDWYTGMDFKVVNGSYCSVRDLPFMREHMSGRIYLKINDNLIKVE